MDSIWQGIVSDFSDVPELSQTLRIAMRLFMASVLAGVLGYEREKSGKSAGMRTHMLVGLGSALFALVPQQAGMSVGDLSRVVQGIVTGIGFIGAGAILKHKDHHEVRGLTTSAGLWLTAAIGMAAGLGREVTAILGTVFAILILATLHRFEQWIFGPLADSHEA